MSGPLDLVVVGGGEHARVVIETARSRPELWRVVGFVDPQACAETTERAGVPRLGDDAEAFRRAQQGDVQFILGIGAVGAPNVRRRIVARYAEHGVRWATVVHAFAWVSPTASLGDGVLVGAGAVVQSGASAGDHVVVNTGAVIEHDVRLGAFAQAAPGAALGGGVVVGEGSYLGLGCRVRDHLSVGRGATVGMGAVVLESVPDGLTVVGHPAKTIRGGGADA